MTRKLFFLIWRLLTALLGMSGETLRFVRVVFQSQATLIAENRKQLPSYQERNGKPRRLAACRQGACGVRLEFQARTLGYCEDSSRPEVLQRFSLIVETRNNI
jgi:hypothetical protein